MPGRKFHNRGGVGIEREGSKERGSELKRRQEKKRERYSLRVSIKDEIEIRE